jgi:hypothetical protein
MLQARSERFDPATVTMIMIAALTASSADEAALLRRANDVFQANPVVSVTSPA